MGLDVNPERLAPLSWCRLRFSLRFTTPAQLPPFKGSTLRGGFGAALRRVACVRRRGDCEACTLAAVCPYRYVFDTPVPPHSARMRRYPYCPHPFILEPPLDERRRFEPGDELEFGLTLVGRAADFVPHVILAVTVLGEQFGLGRRLAAPPAVAPPQDTPESSRLSGPAGRFELVAVDDGASGEGPLYSPATGRVLRDCAVTRPSRLDGPGVDPGSVRLHLLTPLRLVQAGRLTDRPSFDGIVRALLRRATCLSANWYGKPGR